MLSDLFAKWSEQTPALLKSGVTKVTKVTDGEKPQKPAPHSGSETVTQTEIERVTRVTGNAPAVTQVTLANPERVTASQAKKPRKAAADRGRLPKLPKLPPKIEHPNSAAGEKWDPETDALIAWFLGTTPPAKPFQLQQAVYIARPDKYWEYLRQDIAAGPSRARGRTGALQDDLRRLYRVLRDGKDIGGGTA